ncbi:HAMP domain-containing protein [Gordonia pseudamarae]|jgi:two-component system OmpR family sensor kinase|uniref:histidine kinase n=1 Tax=Gordonia pseudamarae TaxID=2831662 RepID=A0ABX6IES9_9ACTN|nr:MULTISPECIES: HAMP domain-containing sensor histidine kinase [Gordonia]MBD0022051.1 HAMP domain-containing histidine kinase [Gordonia sp. (in: high G+C Gram-positive bacteria)]QHN24906.1 HAMP domain-containing protein [Gordonia pseudamarae]QHN33839.1 HAMP domain-containing protein [Gordonia pseudamarae]
MTDSVTDGAEITRVKPINHVPLRVSLVALTLVLVVAGLVVSGFSVTGAMRSDLIARTDSGLRSAIETWARPIRDDGFGGPSGPRRPPSRYYSRFVTQEGLVFGDGAGFSSSPDLSGLGDTDIGPITVSSEGGKGPRWRVVQRVSGNIESVVATPLSDVESTLSRLIWLQVGIGGGVVVVIGVLSYLLVRTSLRPLRRVEETAHAIADGNLTMRVPPAPTNTEVGSLSASLNTMLGHIGRAFAATEESERQARESEETMRRFIADASHELRTPLTSIKGFGELYKQGAVPSGDAMSRIDTEAERMKLLVEDLLMLARLDAHRPLQAGPVDLLSLVSDAVHSARAAAPQRDIGVRIEPMDEPPVVSGDVNRLMQVLRNLINNAIAHTPADATITIGIEPDGCDHLVLSVADTGNGLTEEEARRVFERFYRGDSSRYRGEGGGSGLGLSIVAALVAAHGGTVGVDSVPGKGARFWVLLPREAV